MYSTTLNSARAFAERSRQYNAELFVYFRLYVIFSDLRCVKMHKTRNGATKDKKCATAQTASKQVKYV